MFKFIENPTVQKRIIKTKPSRNVFLYDCVFYMIVFFIVFQWNLVCDKDYMVDLSTTIYMIGNSLGAVLITPFSDRFGRKWVLLISLWIQGVIGVGLAFVNCYALFLCLRFFIGCLNMVSTVKTCLKRPLLKDHKLVFKTNYCLMQVNSIVECSIGSILQYFCPSLSYNLSLRPLFVFF